MKRVICLAFALVVASCALAQTNYVWKVTLNAVDENGNPVPAAKTSVGFYTNSQLTSIDGTTDANGVFIATRSQEPGVVAFPMGIQVEKNGYYFTRAQLDLGDGYDATKWNKSVTLLLKKVNKPIAMYARWIRSEPRLFKKTGMPPIFFTNTIGYDLMVGDWVAPYGSGVSTDLSVTEEFNKKSALDFDFKLTINFPKAGDGIQEFIVPDEEKGSGLRSPHEAPTNGYNAQLVRQNFYHPGQAGQSDYDPSRNYFFRVRTVLDHQGNVVSTHYGKIYGDPEQVNFEYYLNPTPNDRNIEFDPKQNLLGGLKSFEQVTSP